MAEELKEALDRDQKGQHMRTSTEQGAAMNTDSRQHVADEGRIHYRIAADETERIHLQSWLNRPEVRDDPAYRVRLKLL